MELDDFLREREVTGAIFDMDGTLTSSMQGWNNIYACLERLLNVKLGPDFMMRVNHLPMKERVAVIARQYSLNIDVAKVYPQWLSFALGYYRDVFKLKPYMRAVLASFRAAGLPMAIATASDGLCAQAFIKGNNLEGRFVAVTSLSEVSRPKSFPDIYLLTAQKIGVAPQHCLVFEDALAPLLGAKSGGFLICGVQDDASAIDEGQIRRISDLTLGFSDKNF